MILQVYLTVFEKQLLQNGFHSFLMSLFVENTINILNSLFNKYISE